VALAWVAFQIHPVTSLATPVYYLDWFLGGMLLAVLSVWVGRRPRPPAAIALVRDHPAICWLAALVAYAVLAFNPGDVTSLPYHVVQGVIGLLIVTPAVFVAQRSTRIHRLLATPVLAWLGLISYGIYLWHATIVERLARTSIGTLPTAARVTVITAAALVITVTCAAISYYALERPLLRRKNGRGRATPIAPRYGPLPAPGKAADRN
jgi:peptidoglycan/LPS O-acetylase OafA/YrhL